LLKKLLRELSSNVEKMKGLKYFKAEYATNEGERTAKLIAKKFNLELI